MVTVKLAQVPGATEEFVLEDGATVATLLSTAEKSGENYTITVNNVPASTSTVLSDGAIVILAKNAIGNSAAAA